MIAQPISVRGGPFRYGPSPSLSLSLLCAWGSRKGKRRPPGRREPPTRFRRRLPISSIRIGARQQSRITPSPSVSITVLAAVPMGAPIPVSSAASVRTSLQ